MSIITISRGSYSRGKEVAEKLARKLGYDCVSRDILLEASDEFNIPEIKLVRALHDAPTVLERFTHGKERYVSYLRSALLQRVLKDNVVYHGLAGQYFLRDIPHVLKVRITADMEDRVKEEMKRENISAEEALYILKKDDEERRGWGLKVYGTDTWDDRLYDMVLHIKKLTVEDAVEILFETVQKPIFQTTPESHKIISNLALSAKVQTSLMKIAPMVKVTADDGVVIIGNIDDSLTVKKEVLAEIKKRAGNVEGVKEIIFALIAAREQNNHINPFHNIG
ncbi:MAG: cytidylate kinase-like family protein [Deltaproteobacteria bacterium]|nr:MAG: cytidylate kinase-like family protein [Deltaproteobacteria bacterium]